MMVLNNHHFFLYSYYNIIEQRCERGAIKPTTHATRSKASNDVDTASGRLNINTLVNFRHPFEKYIDK